MLNYPDPFSVFIIIAILGLLPFAVILTTSFLKLVIVFNILRSALGVQQVPPTIALNALAIILTFYIMAPVGMTSYYAIKDNAISFDKPESIVKALEVGKEPFRNFLIKHSMIKERAFFVQTTKDLWPADAAKNVTNEDFLVLIPSFTITELTKAFEIGFLIYLPFIAIDLIISNILLAMGMMMVSPLTISLPFKLFLFVMINGWERLIHGLVLTYQ